MQKISVVWLKRDLRLRDHEALLAASESGYPVLLVYFIEPILVDDAHYDLRHWRFIEQSIEDLNFQLAPYNTRVLRLHGDAISCLSSLNHLFDVQQIYSYQEIGLDNTFKRDVMVQQWCSEHDIVWQESTYGAVTRGLANRKNWADNWRDRMTSPCADVDLNHVNWVLNADINSSSLEASVPDEWRQTDPLFQAGGERRAWYTLHHFFKGRGKYYSTSLSKPIASRKACSRLSPYLAWGNMSVRQAYQFIRVQKPPGWSRSLTALTSRLQWHCHFVQKFESESQMQFRAVNRAYQDYPYLSGESAHQRLIAWQAGATGFPLIDAAIKCVCATGYINFRLRATLVSFLCHLLDVDWRDGVAFLGRQFLDFEPGIHYPQFHMQAGITGINIIRLYNPIKQSQDKDPNGEFIRKWLPQLQALPDDLIHTPWEMTAMEQVMYGVIIGEDYSAPIVDYQSAAKAARDKVYGFQKREDVIAEGERILKRHTNPGRPRNM